MKEYYFLTIALVTIALYLLSWTLTKLNKLKISTHRKIWNLVLLITFLICGILGTLLVLRIQYGTNLNFGINKLFWHVETGIVMTLVSIFHIFWHMNYWKCYIKTKSSDEPCEVPKKL